MSLFPSVVCGYFAVRRQSIIHFLYFQQKPSQSLIYKMTKPKDKKDKKDEVVDEYSAKLDMCLTDGVVKMGGSMLLGALTSAMFFRGRRWPIIAGAGIGIGIAYANCEFDLTPPPNKKGA